MFHFQFEQHFFPPDTSGIPDKLVPGANYPVAGNNNGNRVSSVRCSNGPYRFRIAQPYRQFHVRDGFAVRDLLQFGPNFLLKIGSLGRKRKLELRYFSGEIIGELFLAFFEDFARWLFLKINF